MSEHNDGGPAFPVEMTYTSDGAHGKQTGHTSGWETGMTLRDYFAAKALQGILAYPGDGTNGSAHNNATPDMVAQFAYQYADAMLAEREK